MPVDVEWAVGAGRRSGDKRRSPAVMVDTGGMRHVLLRYAMAPSFELADGSGFEQLRTLFSQHGWTVVAMFAEECGIAAHAVVERWGSALDPAWPEAPGVALESALAAPETPDPMMPQRRRLQVRSDATGVRPTGWERIVIRSDGRAEVEFLGGAASALAAVEADQHGNTIGVTVQLGTEPLPAGVAVAAVGIESVADVVLPVRIVDGSRHAIE
jgi:hypothetical protein